MLNKVELGALLGSIGLFALPILNILSGQFRVDNIEHVTTSILEVIIAIALLFVKRTASGLKTTSGKSTEAPKRTNSVGDTTAPLHKGTQRTKIYGEAKRR